MPRLSSNGTKAWGFVLRIGFQGEVSSLSGLTLNDSWGLTRFWVRNALPKEAVFFMILDFDED